MLKFRFSLAILQGRDVSERAVVEQEFADALMLGKALANFAGVQSGPVCGWKWIPEGHRRPHASSRDGMIAPIVPIEGARLRLPSAKEGYGPDTRVIIENVEQLA